MNKQTVSIFQQVCSFFEEVPQRRTSSFFFSPVDCFSIHSFSGYASAAQSTAYFKPSFFTLLSQKGFCNICFDFHHIVYPSLYKDSIIYAFLISLGSLAFSELRVRPFLCV
jgi:hypothetical protein